MNGKPAKPRKCAVRSCRAEFTPWTSMQRVCSPTCALSLVAHDRAKADKARKTAERKADRAKRETLKTRSDWVKDAQREFNRYIRLRDAGLPCICCDSPMGGERFGGEVDAGHYRSVGSAPHLRFTEDNCHAQRKQCNRFGAGRAVDYRLGLIRRIGLARVEAIESDQTPRKWSIPDLLAIRDTYRAKARALSKPSQTTEDDHDDADAETACPA